MKAAIPNKLPSCFDFQRVRVIALVLLASCSALLSADADVVPGVSEVGLVGYYPLDGGRADDATGNGLPGVVTGALPIYDRYGRAGRALTFDGVGDSVVITNTVFSTAGDFTIGFWIWSSALNRMHVLGFGNSGANLEFDFNDASGVFAYWNGGGFSGIFDGSVGGYADGRWHCMALRRSGSRVELYADGVVRGWQITTVSLVTRKP